MAEPNVDMKAPDAVALSSFDDDDLIDYDDEELEPAQMHEFTTVEEMKARSDITNDDEPPVETIQADSISFGKPPNSDRDLSIPDSAPHDSTVKVDPTDEAGEINYELEENTGDDTNGLSAPAEHDEQAESKDEAGAMEHHDQDDEEIDFGIADDSAPAERNLDGTSVGDQDVPVAKGNEQPSVPYTEDKESKVSEDSKHQVGEAGQGDAFASGASASGKVKPGDTQADQSRSLSQISQADAAENDEITWEEPEDQMVPEENLRQDHLLSPGNLDSGMDTAQQEAAQSFVAVEQVELGDHTHEQTDSSDEQEFPAVTVQYKGEEFPLFSITAEGFFTSTTVLEQNIGSILAGFREELANEIATEDELVFQVDELGLEYAESHSQDTLGHVTLHQILDIFDLLVKNQDPDSDRALYTYLFTKPSTTKRFESLIESAAAGTGLDKVIYHFDSPVPHGTNLDENHVTSSHHDPDDDQSPGDASAEARGDQQEYEYIDDLGDTAQTNGSDPPTGHDEQYGDAAAGEIQAPAESVPSGEGKPNPTLAQANADVDAEINAFAEADFEMAMESDINKDVEDGDFDVDGDLTDDYRSDALNLAKVETSASNTVDNEDAGVDMTAEEAAEALDQFDEAKIPDQVDDEIDWREDPAEDDMSTMSAGAIKRSHDLDGLDQQDGPEPKRQRS